ncbi:sulfatase-like hydrolase/transferase [Sulfitobacter sp.]|uniref:sulfatase-like hydrolase/transferase n=1 Tax=Sulfitobacter sp. TaxID=1903071 RepID=UPI003EF3802A
MRWHREVRYDDFHVTTPVCMPNRASFMTGRMPSVHGLRHNGCTLPHRANTFVNVLAAGGYRRASIGKSDLQPFLDLLMARLSG